MIRLFLVRHCETDESNEKRYVGSKDACLNSAGRKHAELLSVQLKNVRFDMIYASGLVRAYETAKAISSFHSARIEVLSDLNEMNFGDFDGLTFDEIKIKHPEKANEYLCDPLNFCFPGGETFQEFSKRVLKALDFILKENISKTSKTILVVAHGGVNKIILCRALNLSLKEHFRIKQDLGCINVIDFFDDFAVVSLMNSKQV